jgi:hypothetical protein
MPRRRIPTVVESRHPHRARPAGGRGFLPAAFRDFMNLDNVLTIPGRPRP